MSRITPLWRSSEISVHRFDHPVEHEDQAYEEVAGEFRASFVEEGTFDLQVGDGNWRVNAGDVMLSHPGMRFRAAFQGRGFNDTCLSITYLAADAEAFDAARSWACSGRRVLQASNRVLYLRWTLARAMAADASDAARMAAEHCASEIFRPVAPGVDKTPLFSDRKFAWYAERVRNACARMDERLGEAFTVSELARSVGMSMFHFTRVFTALVGMPPHRYLLRARLKAAARMLREGAGVTETCFACGFANLSHFSRSFTRRFGVAPSRYAV